MVSHCHSNFTTPPCPFSAALPSGVRLSLVSVVLGLTSARSNIVLFPKVAKGANSSPRFFFSELDCAIALTRGRTENFALKN